MGRPPKTTTAPAKRTASRAPASAEGVSIETLLTNPTVKITRTTMQVGAQIPQQGRGSDYVIYPVTAFKCVRRFVRNGKVIREVELNGTPGQPYYAKATRPGAEFILVNVGRGVITFDKMVIKRPRT